MEADGLPYGDDEDEGGDGNISSYHVVNILPVVESDELKGGEHAPQQVVKAGEPAPGSIIRFYCVTSKDQKLWKIWTNKLNVEIIQVRKSVKPVVWVVPNAMKTEKTMWTGSENQNMRLDCGFVENNDDGDVEQDNNTWHKPTSD